MRKYGLNMDIIVNKNWTDFKTEVTNRSMSPQWHEHIKGDPKPNQYRVYGQDGYFMFETYIDLGSSDATDFETNYQNTWNAQLEYRNDNGLMQSTVSPRPKGTITYFAGIDDNSNILEYDFATTDVSITRILTFDETVHLKDAVIIPDNAPFGSYVDVKIVHPDDGDLLYYMKHYNILGSYPLYINSEDQSSIAAGLELHVIIYNSSPGNVES